MQTSATQDGRPGLSKRMRKGTRSCLPCRKRKIKCSGTSPNGACHECISRLTESACVPQGVVTGGDSTDNKRLKERIAVLEAQLSRLVQRSESANRSGDESSTQALANLHDAIDRPDQTHQSDHSESSDDEHEDEEAAVETGHAPLMRLLGNPIMGDTPSSTQTPESSEGRSASNCQAKVELRKMKKSQAAVASLLSVMPSEEEMLEIFDHHSSWWPLYRDTLGLIWGSVCDSLRTFASEALKSGQPSTLGLLLVSFAISTGEHQRFLPVVEKNVVNDDEYASTEAGFNCLMAVGLCYMAALQPRRAFLVYRRATSLLQLANLHSRRSTEVHEALFWPLFHADRWASLIIGLPYSLPDGLCDLTITSSATDSPGQFLYKHLGIITGRVIDCLQGIKGVTLSAAMKVEEEMEAVKAKLPTGYLDMETISTCDDRMEKCTRLYRVVHFHQLRAYIHLPFFFRSTEEPRYAFSRRSSIDDSCKLLEAYIAMYDTDPEMIHNGTVLNFTAFTAAVVLLLDLVGYGAIMETEHRPKSAVREHELNLVHRTLAAIKSGSETKISGLICRKCYQSLQYLLRSAYDVECAGDRFVLPYFGVITMTRKGVCESLKADLVERQRKLQYISPSTGPATNINGPDVAPPDNPYVPNDIEMDDSHLGLGMSFAYQGPFLTGNTSDPWGFGDLADTNFATDASLGWNGGAANGINWNWFDSDLPPNLGL